MDDPNVNLKFQEDLKGKFKETSNKVHTSFKMGISKFSSDICDQLIVKSFFTGLFEDTKRYPTPKELISSVVYKFQCGLYNVSYYGERIRHLDITSGEQ